MFGGFCQRGIVVRDIIRERESEVKGDDKLQTMLSHKKLRLVDTACEN